jgi:AbrB family looped-hinge helix DNA binding protein
MPRQKRHKNNVIVGEQFRIVIPAELRQEMGIKPGDELMARVKNGQLLLEELDHALKRVQANIADAMEGRSGVEELIQERIREARKERAELEAHKLASRRRSH